MVIPFLLSTVILTNAAQALSHLQPACEGQAFELTGRIIYQDGIAGERLTLEDSSGRVTLHYPTPPTIHLDNHEGSLIRASGQIAASDDKRQEFEARCFQLETLKKGPIPDPLHLTGRQIDSGLHESQFVEISGCVQDAFCDDIDHTHYWLVIDTDDGIASAVVYSEANIRTLVRDMIGSVVSVVGLCDSQYAGDRKIPPSFIRAKGPNAIKVLNATHKSIFDAPLLPTDRLSPQTISQIGHRRLGGTVRCWYKPRHVLLETAAGTLHNVEIADETMPETGEGVEVVGLPETDLFRINLLHASWRRTSGHFAKKIIPEKTSIRELLDWRAKTHGGIKASRHGDFVEFSGRIIGMTSDSILVHDGRDMMQVDASACPEAVRDLPNGCTINVAGIFIVQTESWRPNNPMPRVSGVRVVLRSPHDIVILSRPSWWTAGRLAVTLLAALLLLIVILIWNFSLRILVARRSRALFREQINKAEAECRVSERTRLATELHDSIAQDLAGIAMQIDTARDLVDGSGSNLKALLSTASAVLQVCRDNLRACLWDLRNGALDEKTFDKALIRTITPLLRGAQVIVRFNVPRSSITDATAHAVLQIVRELVSNAIRHGKAKTIRIAGTIDDHHLRFSVTDDGKGFDPETAPGPRLGHFGLNGIRERVRMLKGTVTVKSAPETGTKATVVI